MTNTKIAYRREANILPTEGLPTKVIEMCWKNERLLANVLDGSNEGRYTYGFLHPETDKMLCDTKTGNMPHWWRVPSREARAKLPERYKAEKRVLPALPNRVVLITILTWNDAPVHKLVMHLADPSGEYLLPGGDMQTDDVFAELERETKLGLGIEIIPDDIGHLFDHYDADGGRICHIYTLLRSYEQMLELLDEKAGEPVKVLLRPKGMGWAFMDVERLQIANMIEGLSPLTLEILKRYFTET